MHGVMKIIHGWAESASIGLKLATVYVCVFYKLCKITVGVIQVVMHVLDQLLLALATSIRVSGSV